MVDLEILFGEQECYQFEIDRVPLSDLHANVKTFKFSSISEKDAFLKGLEVGQGWERYVVLNKAAFTS